MKTNALLIVIFLLFSFSQEKTVLEIEITNIRNLKGVILLSLYTHPEQYPYKPDKTFRLNKDSLTKGRVHTLIHDLSPGQYGLCFLDDENVSGNMETSRIGLPLEGYGFANNVKPFMRRPDYNRILFKISPGINKMQLIARYKN